MIAIEISWMLRYNTVSCMQILKMCSKNYRAKCCLFRNLVSVMNRFVQEFLRQSILFYSNFDMMFGFSSECYFEKNYKFGSTLFCFDFSENLIRPCIIFCGCMNLLFYSYK